jgi:phosphoribosylformylglycinamidine synthase
MAHEIADEMTEHVAAEPSPEQVRAQRLYREMGLSDDEYERITTILGRAPNYAETGVFSVMWSEHCCYKSSKRVLRLLSSAGHSRVLQGPGENAGIIDIGDGLGLAFKWRATTTPPPLSRFRARPLASAASSAMSSRWARDPSPC